MSEASSSRLALYTGLTEHLGPQLADALMGYLPETPGTELATRADIRRIEEQGVNLKNEMGELRAELRTEIGGVRNEHRTEMGQLRTEMGRLRGEIKQLAQRMDDNIDRLSKRMDRHVQVMGAGFIALTTALIASGFLG